jgi:hypothetical protein
MVLGDEISKKNSTKALWENKKEVKLKHVVTIGTDDFEEDENYFFALIVDIQFDKNGNLFVLDSKNWRINKYSPKGLFLQSLELKKGKGPGDYVRPSRIAIDKDDKIYIADRFKRVTILDKKGKVLKLFEIREKGMPANIAVGPANSLYLTVFNSLDIHRIFQYNSLNGQQIKVFCKSTNDKGFRKNEYGNIAVDTDDNIYYTASYPYEIKKFSKEGILLNHFSREANFQKPIGNPRLTTGIELMSISMGIAVFPDGKILNLIRHKRVQKDKRKYEYWFDVFSKEGEWLISFSHKEVENEFVRFFNIDPFGYLYLDYFHPYPHIKKYKIEFVDKK